eukprot:5133335-Pyramimonas_sp.AAC.1
MASEMPHSSACTGSSGDMRCRLPSEPDSSISLAKATCTLKLSLAGGVLKECSLISVMPVSLIGTLGEGRHRMFCQN